MRALCVHRACVVRASCMRRACVVRALCVVRACVVRASVVRACVVRAFVRAPSACVGTYGNLWELCAWELMVTYGNFVHGNLWELMGTSCVGSSCVGIYGNSVRGCKAFLHCGFALRDVFTLRCYDAKRFHTAVLLCVTFQRCICSHFMSQCINFPSQSICFPNHNMRQFVDPQRVCVYHNAKI